LTDLFESITAVTKALTTRQSMCQYGTRSSLHHPSVFSPASVMPAALSLSALDPLIRE
jgi:hypothetical protein